MTTLEAAQQLCLVRGYVFGDTGFVARFLRGWRSFAPIGRPSGFPGVTEYAGRNASVRSASVIRFHRALAAREQISARLIPRCFRWRPKSFLLYHAHCY